MTFKEIAGELGLSYGQVMCAYEKGMAKLRAAMEANPELAEELLRHLEYEPKPLYRQGFHIPNYEYGTDDYEFNSEPLEDYDE